MRYCTFLVVFVGIGFLCPHIAVAVPLLQIYLEGAEYDPVTETWVLSPEGSSSGVPFRVWTIGNTAGPGSKGDICDVKLAIAYSAEDLGLQIDLTPSQIGGDGIFGGFVDPSVPDNPSLLQTVTDGSVPVLGDGSDLPSHDIYGEGTVWQEFSLGNFTLSDSTVGDFVGSFPTELFQDAGQINVYEVSVLGGHGATLHFDLYNHVESKNHAIFAPFSHDADGDSNIAPEPSTGIVWSLLGALGITIGWCRRKRKAA